MKTIKTEKQYGNHYEQISMHLRMLQAGASTGSLLYGTNVPVLRTTTAKNVVRQTHADIAIRIKVYYLKTNLFPIR